MYKINQNQLVKQIRDFKSVCDTFIVQTTLFDMYHQCTKDGSFTDERYFVILHLFTLIEHIHFFEFEADARYLAELEMEEFHKKQIESLYDLITELTAQRDDLSQKVAFLKGKLQAKEELIHD